MSSTDKKHTSDGSYLVTPESLPPETKLRPQVAGEGASNNTNSSGSGGGVNEDEDDGDIDRTDERGESEPEEAEENLDQSETTLEADHRSIESLVTTPNSATITPQGAVEAHQQVATNRTIPIDQETAKSGSSEDLNSNDISHIDNQDYDDQLSRRVLLLKKHKLRASKITKELKKFKDAQKAKLFSGGHLKRRKKKHNHNPNGQYNQNAKDKKSKKRLTTKLAQTRQELTTATYGSIPMTDSHAHLISAGFASEDPRFSSDQQQQQQQVGGGSNVSGSLTGTLKQHFPSLQLSSAVQKLILNKRNPQVASSTSSGPGNVSLASKYNNILKYPSHSNSNVETMSGGHLNPRLTPDMFLQHQYQNQQPDSTMGLNGIASLPEYFNHWASSEDTPSYTPSAEQPMQMQNPSGNKVVPVEIIGLDPSITGSILYGDSGASNQHHTSSGGSPAEGTQTNIGATDEAIQSAGGDTESQQVSPMQLHPGSLAGTVPVEGLKSNGSSVLHIHHFHHTNSDQVKSLSVGSPIEQSASQLGQEQANQSPESVASQTGISDEPPANGSGETNSNTPSEQQQQTITKQQQQQQQPVQLPEGTKAYLNGKGELVYLSADGQVLTPAQVGEQEQPAGIVGGGEQTQEPSSVQQQSQQDTGLQYPSIVPQGHEALGSSRQQQQQDATGRKYQQPLGDPNFNYRRLQPVQQLHQHHHESPSSWSTRMQGHQYRWKHRLQPQQDDVVKVMERPTRHQQTEIEGGKQMLMVAYRPQQMASGDRISDTRSPNNLHEPNQYDATIEPEPVGQLDATKNSWGEGQESASVSTKQLASVRNTYKSPGLANYQTNITHSLEPRPKTQQQQHQQVEASNNVNALLNTVKLNNRLQVNRLRTSNNNTNTYQENRTPTLPLRMQTIPMILDNVRAMQSQQLGGSGNGNSASEPLIDTWLRIAKNDLQLQQLNKLNPFAMANQTQNQQVVENLALLKHLQQVNNRLQLQQQQQSLSQKSNSLLAHNNPAKLTNEQLMSLLHDFKSSNSSSSLPSLISDSANNQQVNHANELSGVHDVLSTPNNKVSNRFEMVSASDPSSASTRYTKNFLLHHLHDTQQQHQLQHQKLRPTIIATNGSIPKISHDQTLIGPPSDHSIGVHNPKIPSDGLHHQTSASIGGDGGSNNSNSVNGTGSGSGSGNGNQASHSGNSNSNSNQASDQDSILGDSGNNLGHIALAFILVVSLLTITIVVGKLCFGISIVMPNNMLSIVFDSTCAGSDY